MAARVYRIDFQPVAGHRLGPWPTTAVVDLGFRGVDAELKSVQIVHRGKYKSLSKQQRRWLERRQAIEPGIGHFLLLSGLALLAAVRSSNIWARDGIPLSGVIQISRGRPIRHALGY